MPMLNNPSITISLAKPCHEDWDNMTPNEQGRHCGMCDKTVVDFTLYTDKQLIEFFKNANNNVCGHIPKYQIDRVISVPETRRFSFFNKLAWGTAIASWFGLAFKVKAQDTTTLRGKVAIVQPLNTKDKTQYADNNTKNKYTFILLDASTKQPIPDGYVTLNSQSYNCNDKGVCSVQVPENLIGDKATLYFNGYNYNQKEMEIDFKGLPREKKIYLTYEQRHIMVNGGMVARPQNVK